MYKLFFHKDKDESANFSVGQPFINVSNNLDSHYYVLERVKNGNSQYLLDNYFPDNHPQLISYYTSWKEQETIVEQAPIIKKPKEKKNIYGFLSKKSKNQSHTQTKTFTKQVKEQSIVTIQDALYIQLESFKQINVPNTLPQIKQFMALIYLLAMRIYQHFNIWPKMIPVITESRRYKFIKKGKDLQTQLGRLFEFVTKTQNYAILQNWSETVASQYSKIQDQSQRRIFLGSFLRVELQKLLQSQFQIRMKKGQELTTQTIIIEDAFTLFLKQTQTQIIIDEYQISYYHQDSQNRQLILQNNFMNIVILQGNRNNLIVKYLKQFVSG